MRLWVVVPALQRGREPGGPASADVDNATLIDPAAQILVADDGSSDQTVEVTSKLTAEFPRSARAWGAIAKGRTL
jgi:glycosyltransferase involved in cell wall biosynthesis